MTDWVTILRCEDGHRAAKTHTWADGAWTSKDYDAGYRFEWHELEVDGIQSLSRSLLNIEADPRSFVIRGEPMPGISDLVRRTRDKEGRESASFRGADRHWVMFDFDKLAVPADIATSPSSAAIEWVIRECLPEGFASAAYHWQWSNSAGIKPFVDGVRLHLWYWLDRPACDASWRAWARGRRGTIGAVDGAVFTPVQPHYTSRPVCVGASDPLSPRSGFVPGKLCARVPVEVRAQREHDQAIEDEEKRRRDDLMSRPKAEEGAAKNGKNAYARAALEGVLGEIASASEGDRHDTINGGSYKLGRLLVAGGLDYGRTLSALQDAALAVLPKSRSGEALRVPREALRDGMADPHDLHGKGERTARPARPAKPKDEAKPDEAPGAAVEDEKPARRQVSDWFSERDRRLTVGGKAVSKDGEIGDSAVSGPSGAPHPDAIVPVGYWVAPWATGWCTEGGELAKHGEVVPCPLVISGKCIDIGTEVEHLVVSWKTRGGWRHRAIPRVEALNRSVQRLAEWGLPITADATKGLSKYLVAFEAANHATIPVMRTTSVMGWQGRHGADGYMLGRTHIAPDGEVRRVTIDRESRGWDSDAIAFRGSGGDEDVLADELGVTEGSFERWREAVRMCRPYPRVLIGLYASLASPMLEILGAASLILDWAADPESGKTTSAALAMSVWGRPEPLKRSWDGAGPYMEKTLPALNSLPLWFDESQLAAKRGGAAGAADVVSNAIYTFVQGRAKGAATLTGTRLTRTWRTIMLSTGEQPLVSFCQRGGTRSRVIEVVGMPFGQKTATFGTLSSYLLEQVTNHCGHAGIRWVQYLIRNRDRWHEWGELYSTLFKDYSEDAAGGRLAHARAVLEVTYRLVDKALDLDLPNPMDAIWGEVTAHAADATGADAALHDVVGWFAANRSAFRGSGDDNTDRPPHGGWLGIMTNRLVAFVPSPLERYLKERGYQVPSVLAAWRTKEWCVVDTDRPNRPHKTVRFEGVPTKMIALQQSHFKSEAEP